MEVVEGGEGGHSSILQMTSQQLPNDSDYDKVIGYIFTALKNRKYEYYSVNLYFELQINKLNKIQYWLKRKSRSMEIKHTRLRSKYSEG